MTVASVQVVIIHGDVYSMQACMLATNESMGMHADGMALTFGVDFLLLCACSAYKAHGGIETKVHYYKPAWIDPKPAQLPHGVGALNPVKISWDRVSGGLTDEQKQQLQQASAINTEKLTLYAPKDCIQLLHEYGVGDQARHQKPDRGKVAAATAHARNAEDNEEEGEEDGAAPGPSQPKRARLAREVIQQQAGGIMQAAANAAGPSLSGLAALAPLGQLRLQLQAVLEAAGLNTAGLPQPAAGLARTEQFAAVAPAVLTAGATAGADQGLALPGGTGSYMGLLMQSIRPTQQTVHPAQQLLQPPPLSAAGLEQAAPMPGNHPHTHSAPLTAACTVSSQQLQDDLSGLLAPDQGGDAPAPLSAVQAPAVRGEPGAGMAVDLLQGGAADAAFSDGIGLGADFQPGSSIMRFLLEGSMDSISQFLADMDDTAAGPARAQLTIVADGEEVLQPQLPAGQHNHHQEQHEQQQQEQQRWQQSQQQQQQRPHSLSVAQGAAQQSGGWGVSGESLPAPGEAFVPRAPTGLPTAAAVKKAILRDDLHGFLALVCRPQLDQTLAALKAVQQTDQYGRTLFKLLGTAHHRHHGLDLPTYYSGALHVLRQCRTQL